MQHRDISATIVLQGVFGGHWAVDEGVPLDLSSWRSRLGGRRHIYIYRGGPPKGNLWNGGVRHTSVPQVTNRRDASTVLQQPFQKCSDPKFKKLWVSAFPPCRSNINFWHYAFRVRVLPNPGVTKLSFYHVSSHRDNDFPKLRSTAVDIRHVDAVLVVVFTRHMNVVWFGSVFSLPPPWNSFWTNIAKNRFSQLLSRNSTCPTHGTFLHAALLLATSTTLAAACCFTSPSSSISSSISACWQDD